MKLFYAPGACSIGIHLILEEIGVPFELELVNLREGAQYKEPYTNLNPKSRVPALLRDDGSLLTEFPAIAYWLANRYPEAKLWPAELEAQARALEMMDYGIATVHMQGFSRMFAPRRYTPSEADEEKVKKRGLEIFQTGLDLLSKALGGKDYAVGPYSVADAVLFYLEFWATNFKVELPANLAQHFARIKARPAAQRVLAKEGLA
jgi:glutathione S-transferase